MRFSRVRWAAMEFLLKSQKRNRRRLIIEQLILLLLRILLVLLVGLLAGPLPLRRPGLRPAAEHAARRPPRRHGQHGRRLAAGRRAARPPSRPPRPPSSTRSPRAPPRPARRRRSSSSASAPSTTPFRIDRLNDDVGRRAAQPPGGPEAVRPARRPDRRRRQGQGDLRPAPDARHVLHVVSDFRAATGPAARPRRCTQELAPLTQAQGRRRARPSTCSTSPTRRAARPSRPPSTTTTSASSTCSRRRASPPGSCRSSSPSPSPTSAPAERKNVRVTVKVNGQARDDASHDDRRACRPGVTQKTFTVLVRPARLQPGHAPTWKPKRPGWPIDNTRYAVIEVREKVPLLFVEGDLASRGKAERRLRSTCASCSSTRPAGSTSSSAAVRSWSSRTSTSTRPSTCSTSPGSATRRKANLEAYVRDGGGVAFFLGEQVNVDFYNQQLYADGAGCFPVPLAAGRPSR